MTRLLRLSTLALIAALAAIAAYPAAAADDSNGVQVVEAGSALFPDRAYIMTLPQKPAAPLTTDTVKVTENGKPVKNLSVLSSASADGIGTVLLIDSSNSMKGSIDDAMAAARAFAARNPGQPLSVVFFNARPTVALPLTTDRKKVAAVLAKAPKLAEGTHINDALVAAVAQVRGSALGAARIVLLSDGDDVGSSTSLDAALAQLDAQKIRVYTVGIQSPDFQSGDLEKIASETGATYAAADSPESLTKIYDELGFQLGNEYLLRYRSGAEPDQPVAVNVKVVGAEPVAFSYTTPSTGTAAPYKPAFKDKLLQSWALVPLVVGLMLALAIFTIRALWSLRSNKALVARLGEFVTLPAEEQAAERRKEVDALLLAASEQKKRKQKFRWLEGFSEDVDVAQIKHEPQRMLWLAAFAGLLLGVLAAVLLGPLWFILVHRAADRVERLRPRQGPQGPERIRRAASRESRRARFGAPRGPQPRQRDGRRRRRGARAVEARVPARRHRRAARHPARRGARGDREAHAEPRRRPGRDPRARAARGRRQHRGGARSGDHEHPSAYGHPATRQGADRAGQVLVRRRRHACPSGSSSSCCSSTPAISTRCSTRQSGRSA